MTTLLAERPTGWADVEAAQAGDMDAFARIYEAYCDMVFRFVYFRVGNRQTAEDITGDTFVRALRRIGSVTWQGRDIAAWLVTIARNLVADHFKSGRYRLEVTIGISAGAPLVDDRPSDDPDPGDALGRDEVVTAMRTLVSWLADDQRRCLELRFFEERSLEETAAAMGRNVGAIKALQYRAFCSLRRLIAAPEVA